MSLTGLLIFELQNIKFDYDYEKYFPKEDDDLKFYQSYRDKYGSDSDFLLIGIENKSGIFNAEFLNKIKKLGDSIQHFENVEYIVSPVHNSFNYKLSGLQGVTPVPIIQADYNNLPQDSVAIFNNSKLIGSLFSNNSNSLCIYIETCEHLAKNPGIKLVENIQGHLHQNGLTNYHISGRSIAQEHYLELLNQELILFFIASFLLVILFLWFTFKSFWGIAIPLLVVLLSILWSIGIMHLTGKPFDIMTVMLPTIIFVVGMSDLVHLLNKYLDERRQGQSEFIAIKNSVKDIGLATFLTSVTTAVGFFTLLTSNIHPIKEFGIYAGIGVMVAYVLTFIVVPPILILTKVPTKLLEKKNTESWNKRLSFLFVKMLKHKKIIIASSLLLFLAGAFSIGQLKTNNYLLEDLDDEDPQKVNLLFFENHFSGVRPFEMEIQLKDSSKNILDFDVVQEIDKVEHYLKTKYNSKGIGFSISALDPIRYVYSIKHNNNPKYFKIPSREKTFESQLDLLKSFSSKDLKNKLISQDSLSARYTGKITDSGGAAIKAENEKLTQFIANNTKLINIRLTGTSLVLDKNNEFLAENILLGLLISCALVALLIGVFYKSFVMVVIALLVNILPLVLICLIMYILNIDIKISTSLIFTLAFGIAIDDTIHMLSKLKIELNKGKSLLYALKRTYLSTGKAMLVTSIILCGGFLTLIFSSFTSTYLMGLLISITLLFALLADMVLLPLLIIWFYKVKTSRTLPSQINYKID